MIILAFSDTHGSDEAMAEIKKHSVHADLLVSAGDITVFEHHMKKTLKELNNIGKRILLIHGNHEGDTELKKACEEFHNITFIHKDFYMEDGIMFMGYGGGGFSSVDSGFEQFTKKVIDKVKNKKFVLITHGPPFGNRTDFLDGEHVGNKSYAAFVKKTQPLVHICGHIHECAEEHDKIGNTMVINPGPLGKLIKIN